MSAVRSFVCPRAGRAMSTLHSFILDDSRVMQHVPDRRNTAVVCMRAGQTTQAPAEPWRDHSTLAQTE